MDDAILKKAHTRAYQDIAANRKKQELPKPRSIAEVARERLAEKQLEKDAPHTGYPDLDQIIKGYIPGHLYTLTGNENVGKTSLACNFAIRCARQGKRVLYFALEPENTVVDYLASVRLDKRFEDLSPEEISFDDDNIHVYGKEEVNKIDDLVYLINELDRYDLIIIDHIGYFVNDTNNHIQQQSNILKQLAGLARSKQTAILLIAHLRKKPPGSKKDYTPTADDISGSGAFKQDSTEVMIVVRKLKDLEDGGLEYTDDGILYVLKTKCGPNGKIQIKFQERKANIMSLGEMIMLKQQEDMRQGRFVKAQSDDINW